MTVTTPEASGSGGSVVSTVTAWGIAFSTGYLQTSSTTLSPKGSADRDECWALAAALQRRRTLQQRRISVNRPEPDGCQL
jgi:hypothetical protein